MNASGLSWVEYQQVYLKHWRDIRAYKEITEEQDWTFQKKQIFIIWVRASSS